MLTVNKLVNESEFALNFSTDGKIEIGIGPI